jgi:hypothetical protein
VTVEAWAENLGENNLYGCRATEYNVVPQGCQLMCIARVFFSRAAAVKAALHTKLEAAFPGLWQNFP